MDHEPVPQPFAMVVPALNGDDDGSLSDDAQSHRCGRCRMAFDDDPTLGDTARREWSLCPSCAAIRFPRQARSSARLTVVPDPS